MPTKTWEPPPSQADRDHQPIGQEMDQPRNPDSSQHHPDVNHDVRYDPLEPIEDEEINTHGSER